MAEFHLDGKKPTWRIPAARMKMSGEDHIVPLSRQAVAALRTMGFTQQQHSSHGFRGSASTMLNQQQWNKDAIELQLAHMPRDKVQASYNAADHLPLRRKMMQAWADRLDGLRAGANVVA